ncbi:uncharacterized protein LOC144144838 [Haemaphysalis longicornis]
MHHYGTSLTSSLQAKTFRVSAPTTNDQGGRCDPPVNRLSRAVALTQRCRAVAVIAPFGEAMRGCSEATSQAEKPAKTLQQIRCGATNPSWAGNGCYRDANGSSRANVTRVPRRCSSSRA